MGKQTNKNSFTVNGHLVSLSPRQYEVLLLLAEGLSNKEIALRLVVTVDEIEAILTALYRKLGVDSRMRAIKWLFETRHQEAISAQEENLIVELMRARGQLMKDLVEGSRVRGVDIKPRPWPDAQPPGQEDPSDFIELLKRARNFLFGWLFKDLFEENTWLTVIYTAQRVRHELTLVHIVRKGFTDDEYATLLILERLNLLRPFVLEKIGLSDKVESITCEPALSEIPPTIVRRKYADVIRDGFTSEEYFILQRLQRDNQITTDKLAEVGLADIVEVIKGEGVPKVIRRRASEVTPVVPDTNQARPVPCIDDEDLLEDSDLVYIIGGGFWKKCVWFILSFILGQDRVIRRWASPPPFRRQSASIDGEELVAEHQEEN